MRLLTEQPTLVEQVFEAIVAEVVEGRLQPNQRLIQEEIAAQLGVSRQPVQQALLLLRAEGFVQEAPGRGLIVAPIDVDFVRDIYEVRSVSEGLACRLAAQRGAEQARKDGPALIRAGRLAEAEGSIPMLIDADMRFHQFLYEISGNKVIKEATGPHWRHLQRVMAEVLMRDETPRQIWDQHEAILDAVSRGDARAAEKVARDHIVKAADRYIARLKAYQEAQGAGGGKDTPPTGKERRRKT
ncbi:GntR family transcriptional regulator [Novosphingobium rosa]|uniref:GntR family transcriptional regulator n=1 Tax=Novosphingobium rosa TaxID=76978 RepID=UPI0008354132|nr:GntR family transcriptional regulator [Novosphingobium rosa]